MSSPSEVGVAATGAQSRNPLPRWPLHCQTLMYLKLSVAGHLTIFLTRTRGPFWSIR